MMLLSNLVAQDFTAFVLLFSVGFGLCNGLTYMVPMEHGWRWFPEKPGLVSGIIIGGFGIGTFVFGIVCNSIVNPDNLEADADGHFPQSVNE